MKSYLLFCRSVAASTTPLHAGHCFEQFDYSMVTNHFTRDWVLEIEKKIKLQGHVAIHFLVFCVNNLNTKNVKKKLLFLFTGVCMYVSVCVRESVCVYVCVYCLPGFPVMRERNWSQKHRTRVTSRTLLLTSFWQEWANLFWYSVLLQLGC